jgi:hypothetical protein
MNRKQNQRTKQQEIEEEETDQTTKTGAEFRRRRIWSPLPKHHRNFLLPESLQALPHATSGRNRSMTPLD